MNNMLKIITKIMKQESLEGQDSLMIDLFSAETSEDGDTTASASPPNGDLIFIDIQCIHALKSQSRTTFDENELKELATSIEQSGVLQPILVRPHPAHFTESGKENYQIVAGERRWRASKIANLSKIPCMVLELDDLKVLLFGIMENVQRRNLSPLEEARAYKALMQNYGYSANDIAKTIGKSRPYVSNFIRLLQLPSDIQNKVKDEDISVGHARAIISSANPSQVTRKVIDESLSVRETEKLVKTEKKSNLLKLVSDKGSTYDGIQQLLERLNCFTKDIKLINQQDNGEISLELTLGNLTEFRAFVEKLEMTDSLEEGLLLKK